MCIKFMWKKVAFCVRIAVPVIYEIKSNKNKRNESYGNAPKPTETKRSLVRRV